MSAMRMMRLRPRASANRDEKGEISRARREVPRVTRVEDITPVSSAVGEERRRG
jgi:hypothetical protein